MRTTIPTGQWFLIAGATGGAGRELVELLSPRAPTVRRLTRSANNREALEARGADEIVVGDPFEPTDADRSTAVEWQLPDG